jgi:flagellar M-ring protein FliF
MPFSDYMNALSTRQRVGLSVGVVLILAVTVWLGLWLLRDPMVALASKSGGDRVDEMAQMLDRAKLNYQVTEGGDSLLIARSQLGKARAVLADGTLGIPPNVGFELFKETDFSTTDFAQHVNYQRALQGELTRTIETMAGVKSARVHVSVPESGLFKRDQSKTTAAVSIAMQGQKLLTRAQVRGIQRLVASAVPEIKAADVVILDDSGSSLGGMPAAADGEASGNQFELKRQADQYLEAKLNRLLQEAVPDGNVSLSVDTVLDERRLKVTTDQPIATHKDKDTEQETGVLVKERQAEHGHAAGDSHPGTAESEEDGSEHEYEYQVGHRMEEVLSSAGSIKRITVAVTLQGAPPALGAAAVEQLVASAVGVDRTRGDSVTVLLLPMSAAVTPTLAAVTTPSPSREISWATDRNTAILAATLLTFLIVAVYRLTRRRVREVPALMAPEETLALTNKVREWLNGGLHDGRT